MAKRWFCLYVGNRIDYYDPIGEIDTVKFILEQTAKGLPNKRMVTSFWLDLLKRTPKMQEMQAFELIEFIQSKTSDKQKVSRVKWEIHQQLNHLKREAEIEQDLSDWKKKELLKKQIKYN